MVLGASFSDYTRTRCHSSSRPSSTRKIRVCLGYNQTFWEHGLLLKDEGLVALRAECVELSGGHA